METEFENTSACLSGAQMGLNHKKNWRSKISWHTPFKVPVVIRLGTDKWVPVDFSLFLVPVPVTPQTEYILPRDPYPLFAAWILLLVQFVS